MDVVVSEPMTWAAIRERFPDQWVCLVEIDRVDEHSFEFHTARVVDRDATRETLDQSHPLAGYQAIGHYYVGKVTDPARCRGTQLILSEPMTWSEICARYPDEWVCIVEVDRLEEHNVEFTTARVVCHAKERDDCRDQAGLIGLHYRGVGYRFTGKIVAPFPRALRFFVNPTVE